MSCISKIQVLQWQGQDCARVEVFLTVIGSNGEVEHPFRFDTGADVTMVSEDVATVLGLPAGGTSVSITGSTGTGTGRLVPVTFRFPPDAFSGTPEPDVSSMWVVIAGRTQLALLSLQEVHRHFTISTDDEFMYFLKR
ncbi:MAG: retroviral-like aspartic protease family protein [Planctomycetia bacterium]|nr:retroviral-like aspartic protease family protein [Planctomycetia bacterium]